MDGVISILRGSENTHEISVNSPSKRSVVIPVNIVEASVVRVDEDPEIVNIVK